MINIPVRNARRKLTGAEPLSGLFPKSLANLVFSSPDPKLPYGTITVVITWKGLKPLAIHCGKVVRTPGLADNPFYKEPHFKFEPEVLKFIETKINTPTIPTKNFYQKAGFPDEPKGTRRLKVVSEFLPPPKTKPHDPFDL